MTQEVCPKSGKLFPNRYRRNSVTKSRTGSECHAPPSITGVQKRGNLHTWEPASWSPRLSRRLQASTPTPTHCFPDTTFNLTDMKLTNFGKKTFAVLAIVLILVALSIGAVLVFTGQWHLSLLTSKAYNVVYMAICLPIGIAGVLKLTDFIDPT